MQNATTPDGRENPETAEGPAVNVDVFLHRYLIHAGSQLPSRTYSELTQIARQHLIEGLHRKEGQTLVEIYDLGEEHSAIDIVTSDAPYLVDSVRAELDRQGRTGEQVLHPQLVVERDETGRLTGVHDVDDMAPVPEGAIPESWMHVEVERIPADEMGQVVHNLERVITDVHYAVDDSRETYALIRQLADDLASDPGEFDRDTSAEAGALLRWLADGNFMILGHASYSANELASRGSAQQAEVRGVLRGEASITPNELLPAFRSGAPLVIFKSPLVSTVRWSVHYDCVTVITPGRPQRVHVFLGLIPTEDSLLMRVPVVRKRITEILNRSGVRANSHTGRELLAAIRTLPRDELLEAPTNDLVRLAQLVVDRAEHGTVGVFARTHLNRDFVSVLVYFAADRYGPETRRKVRETIVRYWPGRLIAKDDRIVELGLARMHSLIALRPGEVPPSPERHIVEAEVASVTRRWSDDLSDLLDIAKDIHDGERLRRIYTGAFPEAYKEDFPASTAVTDILRLDELPEKDGLGFHIYAPGPDDPADRRIKVYRTGEALSLARTLPIFTLMGIEVLDERPYELDLANGENAWIYDFGLTLPAGVDLDEARVEAMVDTLALLWRGEIEQDGFNALVIRAGLTWWQANVLRAYAKYLRQIGTRFSQGYIEQALIEHGEISRRLVQLFEARFDPARARTAQFADDGDENRPPTSLVQSIEADLAGVASLDQDRILRSILGLITATLRTNAFRTDANGKRREALAFKLEPRRVADLPKPRPRFEIWVHSPRVEAVHLRFGLISRGGIRWSDRREDFRTEVLGLVKAQMVKNAVIVPVGAKGGFVVKRQPAGGDIRAEAVACYRTFMSSLLDLTDNRVTDRDGNQRVVSPPQTRRYDGDDPYLVVAADKGTATFSDTANEIAADYGYWLGDAFASGGSFGYDHKAMGITARGAWESVKYHFREIGLDTQSQDFTVVGIGDMSGDVFGNGMLLSRHIRLVAAFDHRHIFLDPDPNAARSFSERERIFKLARSSWDDYDRALISPGGGVFPRTLKAIPISQQVADRLGIEAATLSPPELMHAILTARVDLLWNGGIGTYVKASIESNISVGDRANDGLRADATQLRCRVIGEGGNLGCTQLGRIEFALNGGHVNTDAIDNSAGVDTSDHEVNLKILLDRAVATGALEDSERNPLLESVESDVAAHVLRDNYEQNVLLGVGRQLAPRMISVHRRLLRSLEKENGLDRELEFLPSDRDCARRESAGTGLVSPELAVLDAYVKILLTEQINDSTLPDEAWFQRALAGYFPPLVRERLGATLASHPLHREIITTTIVNDMVNRGGSSYVFRAREETGAHVEQVARAYVVVREVFGLEQLWSEIEALDTLVPTEAQHAGYIEIRRLVDRATRWLIDVRYPITDVTREVARFGPPIGALWLRVSNLCRGIERENLYAEVDRIVALGLPRELAVRIGSLLNAFLLLDVVEIAEANGRPAEEVAQLHFALSERFSVDEMLNAVTRLPRADRWSSLARAAMRHDVYAALSAITTAVLKTTDPALSATERMKAWESANAERVVRARSTVAEALARDTIDLATLSVALRVMRSLPV